MDERERLGRIAYEVDDPHGIDRVAWGSAPPSLRAVWIEAAAAVADAVRAETIALIDAKLATVWDGVDMTAPGWEHWMEQDDRARRESRADTLDELRDALEAVPEEHDAEDDATVDVDAAMYDRLLALLWAVEAVTFYHDSALFLAWRFADDEAATVFFAALDACRAAGDLRTRRREH